MTGGGYRLLLAAGVCFVAAAIWWRPDPTPLDQEPELSLPADPPDLYIRGLKQIRYGAGGKPTMHTQALDLAYYEARSHSLVTEPEVFLLENTEPDWRIVSRTATVFNNGDAEFERDVEVTEVASKPPVQLTTSWLRLERDGSFVTTPRPVKLVEGSQVATGVGMDANLVSDDPVITLKSEVAIRYEADSP